MMTETNRDGIVAELALALLEPHPHPEKDVHKALRVASLAVEAERAFLYLLGEDGKAHELYNEWCLPGLESLRRGHPTVPVVMHLPTLTALAKGERIRLQDAPFFLLPGEAGILMPLRAEDHLEGFIGFGSKRTDRVWSDEEAQFLWRVGEVVARSQRRRRELDALRHDQYLLNTLLNNLPDAIYFKDLRSRFVRVSRQIVLQNGFLHPVEIIGKTDFDLFTAEHAEQAWRDEQEVIRTGQPMPTKEEKETWPDGRVTWALTTKMPFRDPSGRVLGTFGISRDITRQKMAEDALRENREQLRQRNLAMEADLERARVIQHAILPSEPPRQAWLDVQFKYQPLDAVGGDFFSFSPLPGDALGVFLGDLTGHGVSAALFMSLIKCSTERVAAQCAQSPKTYLEMLDTELRNQIPFGFVTAVYGVLERDAERGGVRFTYASGGHPDPIVLRAGGATEVLDSGVGALGLIAGFPRTQSTVHLAPGDRLFLYTDGIPETQDEEEEIIGFDELPAVFKAASQPTLVGTLEAIFAATNRFRGAAPVMDDMALLGFEVRS